MLNNATTTNNVRRGEESIKAVTLKNPVMFHMKYLEANGQEVPGMKPTEKLC